MLHLAFWVSVVFIMYAYMVYPVMLRLLRTRRRPWKRGASLVRSVSIVIAARNEESRIVTCVKNSLEMLRDAGLGGEVIVVSDGSTDRTAALARDLNYPQVRVVAFQRHRGKAVAINRGCDLATNEIVVFTDTRQRWAHDALPNLLKNFADPEVGAASGELVLQESDGTLGGVGLYWRLEKWMRQQESLNHSSMGVTGAACAVRRRLFQPIPAGTILDDVYWPMRVVLAGYRVVHDETAVVYDRLPALKRDELRRKIRTLSGNFQLIWRLPALLIPWKNPVFTAFVSHKMARLLVPWAMLVALGTSCVLAQTSAVYGALFVLQVVFYALALVGITGDNRAAKTRLASTASAFVFLNGACLVAFFVWLSGGIRSSWHCAKYEPEGPELEQQA